MRTQVKNRTCRDGGVLAYALVATAIVGLAVVSALTLASNENQSTQRSQAWNECIAVIEAGIEEALSHMNDSGLTNLQSNGWRRQNDVYCMNRNLGDHRYQVEIHGSNTPLIFATGYVRMPMCNDKFLSRAVKCTTRREGIFSKAMIAKETIDLRGNNINADSYISTDPNYSTDGRYDPAKRRDHGDIATNSGLDNSFNVGNANIAGKIQTGPGGKPSLGPNGTVGDLAWVDSGTLGIQPEYFADDMNVTFPEVKPPWNGGACAAPTGGWITNTTETVTALTNTATTISYPVGNIGSIFTNGFSSSTNFPVNSPGPVTTTYVTNTAPTSSQTFPAAGTYIGTVVTREVTTGALASRGTWYDYNRITTTVTYYTYPTFTATYVNYTTNAANTATWYDYILQDCNYELSRLSGSVLVLGNANLWVMDDINISGLGGIWIQPGASLKLYVSAPTATISGQGIVNYNASTDSFYYLGLPTNTKLSLSGNGEFTGAIYAPNADFILGGGGNQVYDFIGSSVTRSVTLNGHYNFHYDEQLEKSGPMRVLVVTSWNEI